MSAKAKYTMAYFETGSAWIWMDLDPSQDHFSTFPSLRNREFLTLNRITHKVVGEYSYIIFGRVSVATRINRSDLTLISWWPTFFLFSWGKTVVGLKSNISCVELNLICSFVHLCTLGRLSRLSRQSTVFLSAFCLFLQYTCYQVSAFSRLTVPGIVNRAHLMHVKEIDLNLNLSSMCMLRAVLYNLSHLLIRLPIHCCFWC